MGLQTVNRFCILVMSPNTTNAAFISSKNNMVLGLQTVNRFCILKT